MKKVLLATLLTAGLAGCTSKPVVATKEHRGDPSTGAAYAGFVNERTEELEQMGGPFRNHAAARQKAQEEASSRFGSSAVDSVTTTWSAGKAQAQDEFTDKLDDMARAKKAP